MDIPDEVVAAARTAGMTANDLHGGRLSEYEVIAEWARRDAEARVVELESVIEQLRDEANAIVDTTRVNGTDFERGQENVAERVFDVLSVHPSVVLADHDAAVWDQGYGRGFYDRELLSGESRDASEGASENPYRGDNR